MAEADGSKAVKLPDVVVAVLFFLLLAAFTISNDRVPLLDSANLAFHEAGHPLLGILDQRMTVFGGTMFQLLFPLVTVIHFQRGGNSTGVALAVIRLGENFHNIAVYMADARVQVLPLVGNGDHDWTEIFALGCAQAGHADRRLHAFSRLAADGRTQNQWNLIYNPD